jgi:hypothetical protein
MDVTKYIDIVFDGPPSAESGRFVEVENDQGASITVGDWIEPTCKADHTHDGQACDQYWRLRIPCDEFFDMDLFAEQIHEISTGKGFAPPTLDLLPQKLLLSVSELVEAMEENRSNKPLVYFACGACGAEDERPVGEHYIAGSPVVAAIYKFFGLGTRKVKCPGSLDKPEGILVEIADSTIRNLHMMHALILEYNATHDKPFPYRVSDVHEVKVDFNQDRPAMHGGRAY